LPPESSDQAARRRPGRTVAGASTLQGIPDGTSNTVLFAEPHVLLHRVQLPGDRGRRKPGERLVHLHRSGRAGPRNAANSAWGDGAGNTDYWWDNPAFDGANTGIGPRSDPNFRQNWNGGVVNPGGIQGSPFSAGGCDYRRLQCLHGGVMNAGLADGSVRRRERLHQCHELADRLQPPPNALIPVGTTGNRATDLPPVARAGSARPGAGGLHFLALPLSRGGAMARAVGRLAVLAVMTTLAAGCGGGSKKLPGS